MMADSLHWLTSKQGDSWTSSSIGPLLTAERLNLLLDDYSSLDFRPDTTKLKLCYHTGVLFTARLLFFRLFAAAVKMRSSGCV